jgi:hypothetical protein
VKKSFNCAQKKRMGDDDIVLDTIGEISDEDTLDDQKRETKVKTMPQSPARIDRKPREKKQQQQPQPVDKKPVIVNTVEKVVIDVVQKEPKTTNETNPLEKKLKTLRCYIFAEIISILFSCFLALYALLAISSTVSIELLLLVLAIVGTFSAAAARMSGYRQIFYEVFSCPDFPSFQKCCSRFNETKAICLLMITVSVISLSVTLFQIVFQLREGTPPLTPEMIAAGCVEGSMPSGVFATYDVMTKNGQAIFVMLFLNLIAAFLSSILTYLKCESIQRFYTTTFIQSINAF